MQLRLATYNVENLFERAKVLNFAQHETGDEKLARIAELQAILEKPEYSEADRAAAGALYAELFDEIGYVMPRSEVGFYLFRRSGDGYVLAPERRDQWTGWLTFDRDRFSDVASRNTAKVIREIDADVLCVNEVETRNVLRHFDSDRLGGMYPHDLLIDTPNDPRGIDVGLWSKHRLGRIRSNVFERTPEGAPLFSRDCLEVEVLTPAGPVHVLLNHFKSKHGGGDGRRRAQAEGVRRILETRYDLARDMIAVLGDLNDAPQSWPLEPLTRDPRLADVLHQRQGPGPSDRWTYVYRGRRSQIDYILVSRRLADRLVASGVERRGMPPESLEGGEVAPFPGVEDWRSAGSDHAAVWADFDLPAP